MDVDRDRGRRCRVLYLFTLHYDINTTAKDVFQRAIILHPVSRCCTRCQRTDTPD